MLWTLETPTVFWRLAGGDLRLNLQCGFHRTSATKRVAKFDHMITGRAQLTMVRCAAQGEMQMICVGGNGCLGKSQDTNMILESDLPSNQVKNLI